MTGGSPFDDLERAVPFRSLSQNRVSFRSLWSFMIDDWWMAKEFRPVDREQQFLLPPDMRDWLPVDHQVWFVIDAVARMDTSVFAARAKLGGAGRAPYDPDMVVALLVWAYAGGITSSRQIERRCREDVAFMVVSAGSRPDHATIARFRAEHEAAFEALFTQVLILCGRAGMGGLAHVAVDGTKIAASASKAAMADADRLRRIARRLIDEAAAVDAAEDAELGAARGDELPETLRDPQRRRKLIDELVNDAEADPDPERGAKRRRAAERADRVGQLMGTLTERALAKAEPAVGKALARVEKASHALVATRQRLRQAHQVRAAKLADAARAGHRLPGTAPPPLEQHPKLHRAAESLRKAQQRLTKTVALAETNTGKINMTDPDCRLMPTTDGFIAGYNEQIVVAADYLILAVHVTCDTGDVEQFTTMIDKAEAAVEILRTARNEPDLAIGTALADCGYNSETNLTAEGPDRLIAQGKRHQPAGEHPPATAPPEHAPAREHMAWRLSTDDGKRLYRKRGATVEPVNAHLKDRRGQRRFARRGLPAVTAEAHLAAAVTNLLRLATTRGPQALTA
jgi:transposase